MIHKIVKNFKRYGLDTQDLIQQGNLGLLRAIDRYDPANGDFTGWAWIQVKFAIYQQSSIFFRSGRYGGVNKHTGVIDIRKMCERWATPAEIQKKYPWVRGEEIPFIISYITNPDLSLDYPVGSGGSNSPSGTLSLVDTLPDEESTWRDTVSEKTVGEKWLDTLSSMDDMTPVMKTILEERLLADEPKTLQEIGDRVGVTRERIRQIEARVCGMIRQRAVESGLLEKKRKTTQLKP